MKICPECHRLSRDDDFCSHCGSAVYGNDFYSDDSLSCGNVKGHSHEKTTYSSGSAVNAPDRGGRDLSQIPDLRPAKKKKGGTAGCITVIVIFSILMSMLEEFDESIGLDNVFEMLGEFIDMIFD